MNMIVYDGSMDKDANKAVFPRVMESLIKEDKDVVYLDADLTNCIGMRKLWKSGCPQVVNCGIAEADMAGIAAGLSTAGKKPYMHTFGPFATRRCFDQLFISIAYAGNSARVFGTDPGVTAAMNGGTHMPFEDMALMRAVPGATVIDVSDSVMLEAVLRAVKDRPGLTYIRTTRKTYAKMYSADHKFTIGKGEIVRQGTDLTFIAAGLMVGEAMAAASALEKSAGVSVRVIDMFTVKPVDAELVCRAAKETGAVITTENHNIIGGLGDAVGAVILEAGIPCRFKKHGVNDEFGQVGPQDFLQTHYGLTAARLSELGKKLLDKTQNP
jgi:transketolase